MGGEAWQNWVVAVKHVGLATWALALGALACAAFARWAARREAAFGEGGAAWRWNLSAAAWFAAALGFAWRLDVLVAGISRSIFRGLGWYEDRRGIQVAALVLGIGALTWVAHRVLPTARSRSPMLDSEGWFLLATLGILALLFLRMSSLHHVDALLSERFLMASLGRWMETGLVAIALCCVAYRLPRH